MHTDYFAVPNPVALRDRRSGRPILRLVVLFAIAAFCLAVDALVLVFAYRAGVALRTAVPPQTLVQIGVALTVLVCLARLRVRVRRDARAASDEMPTRTLPAAPAHRARDAGT
jgi:hypothetical protein